MSESCLLLVWGYVMKNRCEDALVSILMPTYNVEMYIEEAVRSVLKQTYKNYELIIVDDGSTDNTYEILNNLAKEDSRIKLYRNDVNCKICKTLNRAFSFARGSFIARMDGDDISEPNRLMELKKYLDIHPEIAIVGSHLISIDENGNEFGRKRYPLHSNMIRIGNKTSSCVPHFWMARRTVYDQLNGYRLLPYVEDYDFLLRGERIGLRYGNVNQYLYKCRLRNGNTASSNGLKQRKASYYVRELHKREMKEQKDLFVESEYVDAIRCDEAEQRQYMKAANHLNLAIHSYRHPLKCAINLTRAFFESKYSRTYLVYAAWLRAILIIDKIG